MLAHIKWLITSNSEKYSNAALNAGIDVFCNLVNCE